MKTIDEFDEIYTPDDAVKSEIFDDDGQEGMLETFGKDLDLVLKIHNETPKRVWTTVDGDDGSVYLVSGFHFVNRINYVITKEDVKTDLEEYVIINGEETEQ